MKIHYLHPGLDLQRRMRKVTRKQVSMGNRGEEKPVKILKMHDSLEAQRRSSAGWQVHCGSACGGFGNTAIIHREATFANQ